MNHGSLSTTLLAASRGRYRSFILLAIDAGRLIAAACWVNREAFPGKPLFNPESEGCLPMDILVAESNGSRQILDAMAQDSTSRRCRAGQSDESCPSTANRPAGDQHRDKQDVSRHVSVEAACRLRLLGR